MKVYLPPTKTELGWYLFIRDGLQDNARTTLVNDLDDADYVIIGIYTVANRRVLEDPTKLIVVDYGDTLARLLPAEACFLYFKRNVLHKQTGKLVTRNVIPISYPVKREFLNKKPSNLLAKRTLDIGCFFDQKYTNRPWNENRARVARFVNDRFRDDGFTVHVGQVGRDGNVGRNQLQPSYHRMLINTKIVITCNPAMWEGDHRLFEAMISGALVFVDRMQTPMQNPLEHKVHLIYYDLDKLDQLAEDVRFYLHNEHERQRIAQQGFDFVQRHHTYVHRIDDIVNAIESKSESKVRSGN